MVSLPEAAGEPPEKNPVNGSPEEKREVKERRAETNPETGRRVPFTPENFRAFCRKHRLTPAGASRHHLILAVKDVMKKVDGRPTEPSSEAIRLWVGQRLRSLSRRGSRR